MNYNDFGNAPTEQGGSGEVIPDGTLAWAIVKVRPFNLDQGLVLTPSQSTPGNAYLDVELTILDGPYARRKVWDRIMLKAVGDKADKTIGMGMAKVRHILEIGREVVGFAPTDPKYRLGATSGAIGDMVLMELDELRCAIKVKVEPSQNGYPAKNKVAQYLSPNPSSDTHKAFERLVAGDTAPPAGMATTQPKAASPAAKPSWAQGAPAAATQQPAQGRPAWAGGAPARAASNALDKEIPF